MTLQQALAFGLVGLTIAGFVWGRFRYDVIALVALLAGLAVGVIPAASAFDGFRNDVTVIIACALVVSAGFARSGVAELALGRLLPLLKTERSQAPVLTAAVMLLSMATKNVGALAILMPVARDLARRTGSSPSRLLMPMAFGAMVGGLVTLVGTAPNIIVSEVRQQLLGEPFGMYDYAPVGLVLAAVALVFLAFGYRLLPRTRTPAVSLDAALAGQTYSTEAVVPEAWAFGRMRLGALTAKAEGAVAVVALLRNGRRRPRPHFNTMVGPGDVLILEGQHESLDAFVTRTRLDLVRKDRPIALDSSSDDVRAIEAVVGPESSLIGQSARMANIYAEHRVNLLGVSRSGQQLTQRLRTVRLQAGDLVLLQGGERSLPGVLETLGCLPLAEREVRLGGGRPRLAAALILAVAMALVAFQLVPVAVAFFGAAVVIVATGGLRMREAYAALDGPLLVLIAAMIPVSDAIQRTGGADLIANGLAAAFHGWPGVLVVGGVMLASMVVTPFLNNAATVLIVAPIGGELARQLSFNPDPFLMAVAVGAACDFLTPIGHQCNTMVMGPGGYRFSDYARLGAPLSLLVLLIAPPLITAVWSLT